MILYRVTYWPRSGDLNPMWYENTDLVKSLEKVFQFETTADIYAAKRAKQIFLNTNSDGILLERFTMNTEGNWNWVTSDEYLDNAKRVV